MPETAPLFAQSLLIGLSIAAPVGTIGLLWMATTVYSGLRFALNAVFGVEKARGTLHGLAFDLGMIALSAVSFLVSVGLTAAIEYLRRVQTAVFPAAPGICQAR